MQNATKKLKILFLCTGNSCRSQMAEGWARHLKGDIIEAYSAGIETHGLNPNAVKVMAEAGVDISHHRSKHLNELKDIAFDWVITVCDAANESCPIFPGPVKRYHVRFEDPPNLAKNAKSEEEALSHYRRVRDEIRLFIQSLPQSLTPDQERKTMDTSKEDPTSSCGSACSCTAKKGLSRMTRLILLFLILATAGTVLVNSLIHKSRPATPNSACCPSGGNRPCN